MSPKACSVVRSCGLPPLAELAAKIGVPVREATVTRTAPISGLTGDTSKLVDAALSAPVNQLKGPVVVGDGAIAFEVAEQRKVTPQELEQNRTAIMNTLRSEQSRTLRAALLQRLRKEAEIVVNDDVTRPTTTPAGV